MSREAPGDEALFFASARAANATRDELVQAVVLGEAWARVSLEVEVPGDALEIVIAFIVTHGASAGVDDLEVQ